MELDFTPQLLIVDDRAENLELLKALLGKLHVGLELIQSPIKALQDIENKEYALIILDVQMPQMDGFLLAQKIRSGYVNKSTPIIFLTAIFLDKQSESKAYECGGVDFIMKPFDNTILINKINIFLELYKNRRLIESQNKKLTVALNEKDLLEGRLRNLASNYRSILEGQSELILKMDSLHRVEFANKAFTDFFNYTLDGISRDSLASVNLVLQEQLTQGIKKLNGKNKFTTFEGHIVNSAGNNVCLEWTVFKEIEFDDTHYLAIGRDVSERKQLKDTLVKKESVLRKIQKKAKIGSFEWDSYSKIIRGSDEFLRLYDISSIDKENIFEEIKLKTHIDDKEAIERMLLNLPEKNQKIEFEHRYIYNSGEVKHFKIEMYSEYREAEDIFHLYGLVSDISQKKALELTFKESLSLENDAYSDKAIFELNAKNQISYLNDYACKFLECKALKDSKGMEFTQFFKGEDTKRIKKILNLSSSKKGFVFELLSIVTKKHSLKRIVLAAHSTLVNNEKGVRGIMMEIVTNGEVENNSFDYKDIITGLKRQEQEFEDKTNKLKEKVEQELRINDFHRQLLLKKSELESLGKMAGSMVNEINQPLTGISMIMDNILLRLSTNNIDEGYIREKCSQVFADIDRIKKYLSQIGIYNSSQKENTQELIDVKSLVHDSLNLIKKQYKTRTVEVSFDACSDDLYVTGNKYKFQKVIVDILNNAYESIEYKQQSSDAKKKVEWIKITAELVDKTVVIAIKDNGCGIDPDNLNYIFEPFFTTKQSGIGSGLGLYISKGIVQKMNGQISVSSKKNEFTEMKLILPFEFENSKKAIKFENN
ncbi:response regulator [Labilibaculum manganireducens]|uniref:response regulator n=1 Tax=Labilibaculum manganireducens TaxID=1940525 RepID=UPI0029F574C0|nr:response regulator [Labilibaculum manganireducens]